MAYSVDDNLDTSPEASKAGTAAMGLYLLCGVWISRAISQGYITEPVIPAEVARRYGTREWAQRLVEVGLWRAEAAAGYRDLRYYTGGGHPDSPSASRLNDSAEVVQQRRRANRERQARYRQKQKDKQINGRRVTNASVTPSPTTLLTPPPPSPSPTGREGRARPREARGAGGAPPPPPPPPEPAPIPDDARRAQLIAAAKAAIRRPPKETTR